MDALLEDMVRCARDKVREHFGYDLWEADIDWDRWAVKWADGERATVEDCKLSHAIGFICGVAAAMDVTPLMLLDGIRNLADPEVKRELTVATAQHEGTVIDVEEESFDPLRPLGAVERPTVLVPTPSPKKAKRGTSHDKRQRIPRIK